MVDQIWKYTPPKEQTNSSRDKNNGNYDIGDDKGRY